MDVLLGFRGAPARLVWCENQGGSIPVFEPREILSDLNSVLRDLDTLASPGGVDVLVALIDNLEGLKVMWYQVVHGQPLVLRADNLVPSGYSGFLTLEMVRRGGLENAPQVGAFDFVTAGNPGGITWHSSDLGSTPSFSTVLVHSDPLVTGLWVGDVDGDGLADLLSTSYTGLKLFVRQGVNPPEFTLRLLSPLLMYSLSAGE
jgi:hypothetical protein